MADLLPDSWHVVCCKENPFNLLAFLVIYLPFKRNTNLCHADAQIITEVTVSVYLAIAGKKPKSRIFAETSLSFNCQNGWINARIGMTCCR